MVSHQSIVKILQLLVLEQHSVDNIYKVHDRDTPNGEAGEITCNIHTNGLVHLFWVLELTGNFNNSQSRYYRYTLWKN